MEREVQHAKLGGDSSVGIIIGFGQFVLVHFKIYQIKFPRQQRFVLHRIFKAQFDHEIFGIGWVFLIGNGFILLWCHLFHFPFGSADRPDPVAKARAGNT